jgi:hypothetical protein
MEGTRIASSGAVLWIGGALCAGEARCVGNAVLYGVPGGYENGARAMGLGFDEWWVIGGLGGVTLAFTDGSEGCVVR